MAIFTQILGFVGLGLILLSFQFPQQKTVIRVQLFPPWSSPPIISS